MSVGLMRIEIWRVRYDERYYDVLVCDASGIAEDAAIPLQNEFFGIEI